MNRRKLLLIFIGAQIISFALYRNVINGEFVHDDIFFTRRGELRDAKYLPKIRFEPYLPYNDQGAAYRPLSVFSFALNFVIFGDESASFHITNIFLNGAVVFLIYVLILKLFEKNALAIFTAAFYGFLPIHTEAVAFIKARDDIFATLFSLLSWIIFIKATERKVSRNKWLVLSVIFWVFAVLGKELAIVMPALFLLVYWIQQKLKPGELAKAAFFFLVGALFYFLLRRLALGEKLFERDFVYFVMDPLREASFSTRIWTAFKIAFIYISKVFIPINLSATYSYNHLTLVSNPLFSWQSTAGVMLLACLIFLAFYKKTRTSPFGIGALAFLVPYSVMSKFFVQFSEIASEKWMYLPSVGLSLIAGFIFYKIYIYKKWMGISFALIMIGIYASVLVQRNTIWVSKEALAKSMVEDAPGSVFAHFSMADVYYEQGKYLDAKGELGYALMVYQDYAPLMHLVALTSLKDKKYDVAMKAVEKAIVLRPGLPVNYEIQALILSKQGKYQESLDLIESLNDKVQAKSNVRFLFAVNYFKMGRVEEAKKYFDWNLDMGEREKIEFIENF